MKIRFLQDTYIRTAPRVGGKPPIGVVYKGTEMEVHDDNIPGDVLGDNNIWYCDIKGWFYWSGATRIIERRRTPPPPTTPEPTTMPGWTPVAAPRVERKVTALPWAKREVVESTPVSPPASDPPPAIRLPDPPLREAAPETVAPRASSLRNPIAQVWENAPEEKLNWGVRNYRIVEDWWQGRRRTGRNVRIALLGTGADRAHPDLPNIEDYYSVSTHDDRAMDYQGVGTQAAIVAAGTGSYTLGVAPEAKLLIGKIGDQEHLVTPAGMLSGLEWALNKQADIIAILVHFHHLRPEELAQLEQLLQRAGTQGACVIAPVGTGRNARPQSSYPARLEGVLSIGAHDQYGQSSTFSARSYDLDLLAPGEQLLVASAAGQSGVNHKSTAIATAFTAGVIALLRQESKRSPEAIYQLLRETAVEKYYNQKGHNVSYGHGLLNPIGLLEKL